MPLIDSFNHLLALVSKLKSYLTVFSLYRKLNYLGVRSDLYILNISINCYYHLRLIKCGSCLLGEIMKRGYEPN